MNQKPETRNHKPLAVNRELMQNKEILGIKNLLFLGLGLAAAVGLKYYYRRAGADDLLWILQPTTSLVQGITGMDFIHESDLGFVSGNRQIIIAPACAGMNFLIIAFCMAFFSFAHWFRSGKGKALWLCMSAAGAYGMTLLVNSLRITVSIYTYGTGIQYGWLTPERIHRIQGVIIYFSFLLFFYWLFGRLLKWVLKPREELNGENRKKSRKGFAVKSAIPLFWYCVVALGVPLLNVFGQERSQWFWEHCGIVIGACLLMLLILFLIRWAWVRIR
jgi:exosortase K